MKFNYRGYDQLGKAVSGSTEADSPDAARDALRKQGFFITSISGTGPGAAVAADSTPNHADGTHAATPRGPLAALWPFRRRIGSLKDLAHFARQLSILTDTGTTVPEGLRVVAEQMPRGPFRRVIDDLCHRVDEGAQLSEAMARHPRAFDPVCRALVSAGEQRGRMGDMLRRLSDLTRQQHKTRAALLGAMVYPGVLLTLALIVSVVMLVFVMPRFEDLFKSLSAPLPPTTRFMMDAGHFLRAFWWAILLGLGAALFAASLWFASDTGKRSFHVLSVRTPLFGSLVRALATARTARMLGVLLDGKVALLDALALARLSVPNTVYQNLIARAEQLVTRGEPISAAFADRSLVHASVHQALKAGERTGQVAPVLLTVADFLDEDNDAALKNLSKLIEPMILVLLGLVVGAMAASMFIPLFDLAGAGGAMAPSPAGAPGATP